MPNTQYRLVTGREKAKLNLNILNVKETEKDSINSNQVLHLDVNRKMKELREFQDKNSSSMLKIITQCTKTYKRIA